MVRYQKNLVFMACSSMCEPGVRAVVKVCKNIVVS